MSATIEQLRNVAWYCENARDAEDMIQCLESIGICWQSGRRLEARNEIYKTIADGYAFLLYRGDRLLCDDRVHIGQKLLLRVSDNCDIPLISWAELHGRNWEPVSLSEYLVS